MERRREGFNLDGHPGSKLSLNAGHSFCEANKELDFRDTEESDRRQKDN